MPFGQERGGRPRIGRAPSLRVPVVRAPPPAPPPRSDRPLLRLAVSRGMLGIELDAPFAIGPLSVVDLAISLPGVRFPVDLSGGVARFRHRRGALARLAIEASAADLVAWAAPRLRGILGDATPELVLAPIDAGVLVGARLGAAALAFDVIIAPIEGDLRLLPERARGVGLGGPPHLLAMRALSALSAPLGRIARGAVVIPAASQLARHLLPAAGARAPIAAGVRWDTPIAGVGRFSIEAREGAPPALGDRALRALELADLAGDADDAAWTGDLDRARALYLAALERAPRHLEISQRLAWLDAAVGERPEGALSTLVDALPAAHAGILGGELLLAVGDRDGALTALSRAAQAEAYGPLAALGWLGVARLAGELDQRLDALDQAVARAPALDLARWARLETRLELADLRGARADADHLEAAARGADARHAVWRRAADAFLARGFVAEASALFERALRYAPESAEAVAGLARSLRAAGQDRRALDLFARAVALAARAGRAAFAAEIELARGLAEIASDRPAAIARVRAVPPGEPESFEARFLEGRWRAELGDLAGAAIAFGRLRDAVELAPPADPDRAASVAALLADAAHIEERDRADLHAAQRDLGLALRLRPRDRAIAAAFRRVAAAATRGASEQIVGAQTIATTTSPEPVAAIRVPAPPADDRETPSIPRASAPLAPSLDEAPSDDAALDHLAEQLTDRLRADPSDHATAMALADVLSRLGRDLDLLALLSARIEEGDDATRREVAPRRRAVLLRLAAASRAAGRASEADLYDLMAASDAE